MAMANVDAPHGFVPVGKVSGSGGAFQVQRFTLTSANAAIGVGDPIVSISTGLVDRGATTPAEATFVGIAAESKAANAGASTNPITNSILVWCSPDIIFEAQTDNGTGTSTAQTAIGQTMTYVIVAPVNGVSQAELDESDGGTTNTRSFKVVGLYPVVGNSFGEFNRLMVVINSSALKGNVLGV
jgi:hypothetical protein